jgi:DNA primase small subunit
VIFIFEPASPKERERYYREEWDVNDIPDFILNGINRREFGFDHIGKGPNDRYRVFRDKEMLRKFMRYRSPFAAYCSVAFYQEPRKRGNWIKSELVFDVDAKDMPLRSCGCNGVCEICLNEARELVAELTDTLKSDLGLKEIHTIYSGRGYHIRVLDEDVMTFNSEGRSQILKYLVGAEVPKYKLNLLNSKQPATLEHFSIPMGYPALFTKRLKHDLMNINQNTKVEDINPKLKKDIIKHRDHLNNNEWGIFKSKIGPKRYINLINAFSKFNLSLVDAKVSIDLKRIFRLPSSLHSKVSMKSMEVKNIDKFDPLKSAVPKFVEERENKKNKKIK